MGSDRVERDDYDLAVVGGGTAGLVAARTAASFGARTVLIDRGRPGGDCLWTGCVPSKALLEAADGAARAGTAGREAFAGAMARAKAAIADIEPVDSAAALERDGVHVLTGDARFTGPRTLAVGERTLRFGQAVVATGASPRIPAVPGLEEAGPLTTDDLWDLTEAPGRLLVLGGGAAGCELAQALARLGSRVVLVHRGPRLLEKDVPDASAAVLAALEQDGVDVRLGAEPSRFEAGDAPGSGTAVLPGGRVAFDRVLVVAGRRPDTRGLGLELAGVGVGAAGHVRVQRTLRTSNPRIWAAGDATPLPQYTHTAGMNGSVVAANAVLGLGRTVDPVVPHCTFTQPEVAAVGLQAPDADPQRHRVIRVVHEEVDRAVTARRTAGFTEIVVDGRGRVLGATVVSPRAGETIGEAALAVRQGMTAADVATTVHPYPTWSDGFWNACIAEYRRSLGRGGTARALGVLAAVRRLRLRTW